MSAESAESAPSPPTSMPRAVWVSRDDLVMIANLTAWFKLVADPAASTSGGLEAGRGAVDAAPQPNWRFYDIQPVLQDQVETQLARHRPCVQL